VDAINFWHVHDAEKAALEITNYRQAIDRVALTSLREMIGSSMLSALLSDRKTGHEHLRSEIGRKTAEWGISVSSLEIRDVAIPGGLQDAMSRQAQAEREKQARVILGSAEAEMPENLWRPRKFTQIIPLPCNCGNEYHLRDHQGAGNHDPDSDIHGRQYEFGIGSDTGWPGTAEPGGGVQDGCLRA
jgi:hypothetical protein